MRSIRRIVILIINIVAGILIVTGAVCCHFDYAFIGMDYYNSSMIMAYLLTMICFKLFPKGSYYVLILFVILLCLRESFIGLLQVFSISKSNHYLYTETGSFSNPGIYGGFLAICISILLAFCINNRESYDKKNTSNLLYWAAVVSTIVALIILPSTQSRSALLALCCSMLFLIIGTERIRNIIKPFLKKYLLWIILGITILSTSAYLFKKPSADGRFFMDKICIKAIIENGWKGAGRGHFGESYGETQARYFKYQIDEKGTNEFDWRVIGEHERLTAECPDNAFNEYLFIGVEGGPIIMLLFIGVIVIAIVISFSRCTIWCYGMTTFALFAFFSYPLHVKQFQLLFSVLLAVCMSDRQQYYSREIDEIYLGLGTIIRNLMRLVIVVLIVWINSFFSTPMNKSNKQAKVAWERAERLYKMKYYEYAVEDCDTLLQYMKFNYKYLFAYGQSLNKISRYEKSDSILKQGAAISNDPMFWNVMGNNSLALGRYREAEERYKHAFYMVPNRLYPLYLLANLYYIENDTVRFLEMTDVVESFVPKVESINTENLRKEIRDLKQSVLLEVVEK